MAAKTYSEWILSQETVTPEQAAGHRNFTKRLEPLHKELARFLKDYSDPRYGFPATKFSQEEDKVLRQAARILDNALTPMAMLPRVEEKRPLILRNADDRVAARVAKRVQKKG
jgi:hypothetical protein